MKKEFFNNERRVICEELRSFIFGKARTQLGDQFDVEVSRPKLCESVVEDSSSRTLGPPTDYSTESQ